MDKRSAKNSLNNRVATTINRMITNSNNGMLLIMLMLLVGFGYSFQHSSTQLNEASGVFEVKTQQKVVRAVPTIDSIHFFDDTVNAVQNYVSLKLYEMLNHTSTSFTRLDSLLSTDSGSSFPEDLLANLRNLQVIDHLQSAEGISSIEFKVTSVPLVINAYTSQGESYTSILLNQLNTTSLERWSVEVTGTLTLKHTVSRVKARYPVRFYIDVIDTKGFGKRQDFIMTLMSKWEMR
ncbi:hypothetical protein [Vibrio agarivorans]|uniref:hypothetical protein n=1 Tax=Vibrio agarivorans TaxID=153622 RepID=UPI0025B57438|nr:hypothetical protein [Vibrio agarivorans]MDN3661063.1 hypothetical protein [Vibrio agarivorans]